MNGLYMRLGIGLPTIILLIAFAAVAIYTDGIPHWIGLGLFILFGISAIYRVLRWNWPGWHSIHHRAMQVYARVVGIEAGTAQLEGREFDMSAACSVLGQVLNLAGSDMLNIIVEIRAGGSNRGYLAGLVDENFSAVATNIIPEKRTEFLALFNKIKPGPHLVIARAIEKRFGRPEAAKYAVAIVRGDAK